MLTSIVENSEVIKPLLADWTRVRNSLNELDEADDSRLPNSTSQATPRTNENIVRVRGNISAAAVFASITMATAGLSSSVQILESKAAADRLYSIGSIENKFRKTPTSGSFNLFAKRKSSQINGGRTLAQSGTNEIAAVTNQTSLRVLSERRSVELDLDCALIADLAVSDALSTLDANVIALAPNNVMFGDDGILTLQWKNGEFGAALMFAGDGMASIAIKRPGQRYAENGIDVAVEDALPQLFFDVLQSAV
jgi:hypothetical protein